jgi:ABC-type transport system substrate-binding protein
MKKALVILVIAMLVVPLTTALGQGGAEETFQYSSTYDMTTLNPILMTDGGSFNVSQFVWAGLFNVDPMTGLPVPGLASWEISEDGLTYTFTIRDDANWSDGTPISAQDFKFTYDAVASPLVESPRKSDIQSIAAVNIIDDKTFEVVLSEVNCTIWNNLGAALNSPLPSHKYAADFSDIMTSDFNLNPDIASGPYILEDTCPTSTPSGRQPQLLPGAQQIRTWSSASCPTRHPEPGPDGGRSRLRLHVPDELGPTSFAGRPEHLLVRAAQHAHPGPQLG